jgi:hypothetical protein
MSEETTYRVTWKPPPMHYDGRFLRIYHHRDDPPEITVECLCRQKASEK